MTPKEALLESSRMKALARELRGGKRYTTKVPDRYYSAFCEHCELFLNIMRTEIKNEYGNKEPKDSTLYHNHLNCNSDSFGDCGDTGGEVNKK